MILRCPLTWLPPLAALVWFNPLLIPWLPLFPWPLPTKVAFPPPLLTACTAWLFTWLERAGPPGPGSCPRRARPARVIFAVDTRASAVFHTKNDKIINRLKTIKQIYVCDLEESIPLSTCPFPATPLVIFL